MDNNIKLNLTARVLSEKTEQELIDYLELHKYSLDWTYVSRTVKLTENIIDKFNNFIDWNQITKYQMLSLDFIRKNLKKLNINDIVKNQKFDYDFFKSLFETLPQNQLRIIRVYISQNDKIDKELKKEVELNFEFCEIFGAI